MKKFEDAFSLVELMVVVGIIGILASLAVPKLTIFMAKSKQSEAKVLLPTVFSLEQSYYADNNTYSISSSAIGFSLPSQTKYFRTLNIAAGAAGIATSFNATFTASANALCNGSSAEDWQIDQDKKIQQKQGSGALGTTFSAPSCN